MVLLVYEHDWIAVNSSVAVLDIQNTRGSPSIRESGVWEVDGVQKLHFLILIISSQAIILAIVFVFIVIVPFNSYFNC